MVDTDTEELQDIAKEQLPETFIVRSGSGKGLHFYFICDIGKSIRLNKPRDSTNNIGDIQAVKKQVVGPNCIHPDTGNRYKIENNAEIAELEADTLRDVFVD